MTSAYPRWFGAASSGLVSATSVAGASLLLLAAGTMAAHADPPASAPQSSAQATVSNEQGSKNSAAAQPKAQLPKATAQTATSAPLLADATQAQSTPAAPAAAAAPAPSGGLQEVIVTATRRAENVQNVPITVNAFTSQQIQTANATSIHDLSNMTAGATLDQGSPFSGDNSVLVASIRGIGQDDFAFNLNPSVGVYVDGVYYARTIGANQDLLDVDRVEVVEGPQGTLFGANTIAGAISIITHTPGNDFRFQAMAQGGSFDQRNFGFTADLPIISNTLLSSITVSSQQQNGYENIIPYPTNSVYGENPYVVDPQDAYPKAGSESFDTMGGQNLQVIRGKLLWNASDNFKVTFTSDWSDENQPGMPESVLAVYNTPNNLTAFLYNTCISSSPTALASEGFGLLCNEPRASVPGLSTGAAALGGAGYIGGPPGPYNYANHPGTAYLGTSEPYIYYNYAATDTGNIDESYADGRPNFASYVAFGDSLTEDWSLSDALDVKSITGYRQITWSVGTPLDGTPETLQEVTDHQHQWQVSQEFQFSGKAFDNRLNWVGGLFYFNESGFVHDYVPFEGFLYIYDYSNDLDNTDLAAYFHLDYQVTDKLSFTAGGRYTDIWSQFNGGQADLNGFAYKITGCYPPTASAALIGAPASLDCQEALGFPDPAEPLRYVPDTNVEQNWRPFDPTLAIQYHLTDEMMAYLTWGSGFQQGGWTTRLSAPVLSTNTPAPVGLEFGPETDHTWELGLKSEWLDNHLLVNTDVFYTQFYNYQLNVQTGASPVYLNAGNLIIKGAELTTQWVVTNGFSVRWTGAYIDDYYTYVNPAVGIPANPSPVTGEEVVGIPLDAQLPKTPRFKTNIGPQYQFGLPNSGSIVLNAFFTYTTSMFNDSLNTVLLERPTTRDLDMSVRYISPDDNYEFVVGGTNITDDRYLYTGSLNLTAGEVVGSYSPPAEWYAQVRVNLGK